MTPNFHKRIWVLIAVFAVLSLQFGITLFIAEPYPGFIFPGFGRIYQEVEAKQPSQTKGKGPTLAKAMVTNAVIVVRFQSGLTDTLSQEVLLTSFKQQRRTSVMRTFFYKGNYDNESVYRDVRNINSIKRFLIELRLGLRKKFAPEKVDIRARRGGREWVTEKVRSLYTDQQPMTLTVYWVRDTLLGDSVSYREVFSVYHIDLIQ